MKVTFKVLIVDDSSTMRKVLTKELLKLHFSESNITEASDGREAILAVMNKKFDLIIMDWNMPNILGIEAVRAIRGAGIDTPILMVTTEAERENVVSAIQAGANNYLVKPFTSDGFRTKVMELIGDLMDDRLEAALSGLESDTSEMYDDGGLVAVGSATKATRVDFDQGAILSDFEKSGNANILSFTTVMPPGEALRWLAQSTDLARDYDLYHLSESKGYIIFTDPESESAWGVLYPVYVSRKTEKVTVVEVGIKSKYKQDLVYNKETQGKHEQCYQRIKAAIFKEVWR